MNQTSLAAYVPVERAALLFRHSRGAGVKKVGNNGRIMTALRLRRKAADLADYVHQFLSAIYFAAW
jgi:hypothetical protein